MALKIILIVLVVLLTLIVVIPFALNMAGLNVLQFGSVGGVRTGAGSALLRSTTGGDAWEDAGITEDKKVNFPAQPYGLSFHPLNPNLLFLGTKGAGLWKSVNDGGSWTQVKDSGGVLGLRGDVYKALFSPSNPDILYLVSYENSRGRVLRSDDQGKTFREIYFVPGSRLAVTDLFVSQTDPNHIIIATEQGGILDSTNGGKTWRVIKWFTEGLTRLIISPASAAEMYVTTASGALFKTVDGGDNWAALTPRQAAHVEQGQTRNIPGIPVYPPPGFLAPFGARQNQLETIILDPNDSKTLYAGSQEGLLRSTNSGFTWNRLNILILPEALPVSAVAVFPRNPSIIFIGASSQLYRSDDGGIRWSVSTLPTQSRIRSILIHPLLPQTMFAVLGR